MDDEFLIDALRIIAYVTGIPKNKKYDVEFLRATIHIAHTYAEVALEHDKKIRSSNRHSTGDDHST